MKDKEYTKEIKQVKLSDYIKSRDFEDFQRDTILYNEEFRLFKDELFGEGDKFDSISELEDVFLLQKHFYEGTGVYLVFPIAAKYVYEQATDMDCVWCSFTYDEFESYLFNLIQEYEKEQAKD